MLKKYLAYSQNAMTKPMTSKFDSKSYRAFRPLYPKELFSPLLKVTKSLAQPVRILDLACGTGQSLESFIVNNSEFHFLALDHDAKMLEVGKQHFLKHYPKINVDWKVASAENTNLDRSSIDAILVGSAIHWFEPLKTLAEINRILKPRSFLFVFEYQFPRSLKNLALNQWIKTQFNTLWKAPQQKPRGSLKELIKPYLKSFEQIEVLSPPMHLDLTADDFFGDLISQSRYLHYESTLSHVQNYRSEIYHKITQTFESKSDVFDFQLKGFLLQKKI